MLNYFELGASGCSIALNMCRYVTFSVPKFLRAFLQYGSQIFFNAQIFFAVETNPKNGHSRRNIMYAIC